MYLNEELGRLKKTLGESRDSVEDALVGDRLTGVLEYLEEFRKRDFEDEDLNKILKSQELVRELQANDQI